MQPLGVGLGHQMKIIKDILSIKESVNRLQGEKKTIGLVTTMGALHRGHISLIDAAVKENDVTIATIFVNPIQFNNPDDLKAYPATLDADILKLKESGCDYVFLPSAVEMYSEAPVLNFNFGHLEDKMEGAFRPGHFSGVALVVMKLFNLLRPTIAYFGQKDLQQFKIIEKMVFDTSLGIKLKMMPVIREESGLALSSRNQRLSAEEKIIGAHIYQALTLGKDLHKNGRSLSGIISGTEKYLMKYPEIKTEYITMVNLKDLQYAETVSGEDQLALCFAGYIGKIRLIDNVIIN